MAATNPYTINAETVESLAAGLADKSDSALTFDELSALLRHIQKYRLRRPALVTRCVGVRAGERTREGGRGAEGEVSGSWPPVPSQRAPVTRMCV